MSEFLCRILNRFGLFSVCSNTFKNSKDVLVLIWNEQAMPKRNVEHSPSPDFTQPSSPWRLMSHVVGHTFTSFCDVRCRGRAQSTCTHRDAADSAVSDNASRGDSEIIWENANQGKEEGSWNWLTHPCISATEPETENELLLINNQITDRKKKEKKNILHNQKWERHCVVAGYIFWIKTKRDV